MSEVFAGMHPNFRIMEFEVSQQRVLRRLSQITHLTRDGSISLGSDTTYRYALVRPVGQMRGLLHTDREVMVVFSDFLDFQSRTLDAFDRILSEISDDFRVEKVARILVSGDYAVATKVKRLFESKPDAPVVVPFHFNELTLATTDQQISSRIREFTFARDLFSMSSPLRSDLYFYGRSGIIHEISAKLAAGENFGLFGLRRSGKTSIVHGIARAITARSGASVVIDCQSPAVHQRRWNELLEYIANSTKRDLSSAAKVSPTESYNEKDAAETFLHDMRAIKKRSKVEFIGILFDEIERISFGTASSEHWNSERDFLLFWQAIRYGFQSSGSPFSFAIVGTNPSAVERVKIFESDNPLFGNVERRFIPMFSATQVAEMVDSLGSIMGVRLDDDCKNRLHSDFGGHPFLTRYACSYIAGATRDRPTMVDRTTYAVGIDKFKTESASYVDSVVGLLKEEYPDEYEMLKSLGMKDLETFNSFAEDDPSLCEHLEGYGIVARGAKAFYFKIGVVERYFEALAKPTRLLSTEDRIAEISAKRNALERDLRSFISMVFRVSVSSKERTNLVLGKLSSGRRAALADLSFDQLLSVGESPLFFDELKSLVLGHWDKFSNSLEIEKNEFEYHMNTVNRSRADAHAKNIPEDVFDKWRVSISELSSKLEQC